MSNKDDDINSLSHSKWRCHYHVVFAPKFRRQAIYGKIKTDIGKILRQLCEQKGIEIIEAELCPDHVHMLLAIPPKYSVAQIMGYLKGKSSLMIFDRHANMKYKYGNRHFWCRGYYVDTVGRNKKAIAEYIRSQLQEDIAAEYGISEADAQKMIYTQGLQIYTTMDSKIQNIMEEEFEESDNYTSVSSFMTNEDGDLIYENGSIMLQSYDEYFDDDDNFKLRKKEYKNLTPSKISLIELWLLLNYMEEVLIF